MRRLSLLVLVTACRSGLTFNDPVIGTLQNRAEGGCLAQCLNGTECDSETGTCEQNPCAGRCRLARCDRLAVPPVCRRSPSDP